MVDGMLHRVTMPETIEIVMMSVAALILVVGKANVHDAVKGNVFGAGMNAMVAIFGIGRGRWHQSRLSCCRLRQWRNGQHRRQRYH